MLTPAQRSVIWGGPPGRPRAGLIAGVAAGLGCALIVLDIDMVESVDSARHSVVPFLVALPLALLPRPLRPSWPWRTSACNAVAPLPASSRSAGAR